MSKYDIFISYRRIGGAQYARILQLMLQQRGYKVFLDYDELTDGVFGNHIRAAIKEAPVFMIVLSNGSMERCLNENDWFRQEILLAIKEGKHLIPVNPDNTFDGFPEDTDEMQLPPEIRQDISSHQFSDIGFGQTLGVTIDLMIKNRIVPTLGERNPSEHVDADFDTAQETLRKQDSHRRFIKRVTVVGLSLAVLMVLCTCYLFWQHQMKKNALEAEAIALQQLRTELQEKHKAFGLRFKSNLTRTQMCTVDTILVNMRPIRPDTLWMSQFECTVGQWQGIVGGERGLVLMDNPVTQVTLGEILFFIDSLFTITHIPFALPSVDEWEYAAHGGSYNENTLYAGSDNPDEVAWYFDNSGNRIHPSNGLQGKDCNSLDLFDLCGNVGELCMTPYDFSTENARWTVCGGDYLSEAGAVTIESRTGIDADAKSPTVGFRLIIRKQ